MIIEFMDETGAPTEPRQIAFDGAQAGVGDVVLVNIDGGAANIILNDKTIVADYTICGVIDHFTYDGEATEFREFL
jgi:microcompartment protein CcmK/EutM